MRLLSNISITGGVAMAKHLMHFCGNKKHMNIDLCCLCQEIVFTDTAYVCGVGFHYNGAFCARHSALEREHIASRLEMLLTKYGQNYESGKRLPKEYSQKSRDATADGRHREHQRAK